MSDSREFLEKLSKRLVDEGRLMEAGWISYRAVVLSPHAPAIQLEECRIAFYAGAQHLFGSIMTALDPGREPTEDDLRRMSLVHAELEKFIEDFKKKHGIAPGMH